MDQNRFDHFARGLAAGITRRRLLVNLSGVAIGGVLVAGRASETEARKKKRGKGKRRKKPTPCMTCSDTCPGAAENTPTKTISFAPTGDPNYCTVLVNMTGYAGCATSNAEYWIRRRGPEKIGDVTLGPTDISGASQTNLGSYGKHGEVDIRINGVASEFSFVDC